MVIEFFGVPGSGKTTGARYLSSELGIPFVKGGEGKSTSAVMCAITHPVKTSFFLVVALQQTAHSHTWALFRWRIRTILGTFSILHRATRHGSDTIVDEGLLQRVLSIYEEALTEANASRIVRLLSPELVVYITDTERQFQRYNDSTHPRRRLGDGYMDRWKDIVRQNTGLLYRSLAGNGTPCVVASDSCDTRIADAISAHLSRRNSRI